MTDIPKLEYEYTKHIDWEATLSKLSVGDIRVCELTPSHYTLLCVAKKKLREEGREFRVRKLLVNSSCYCVSRSR